MEEEELGRVVDVVLRGRSFSQDVLLRCQVSLMAVQQKWPEHVPHGD